MSDRPMLIVPAIAALALAGALSVLPRVTKAQDAAEVTFDIDVRAYCPVGVAQGVTWTCPDGDTARCPLQVDLEATARDALAWVSRIYADTGVSLRLGSVSILAGTAATAEGDDSLSGLLFADAATRRSRITYYVLPCLNYCFAPCVPDPALPHGGCDTEERGFGFFCNGVDALTTAHELSHFFCIAHPHTQGDRAQQPGFPAGTAVNHDGDGLSDTPADPAIPEVVDRNANLADRTAADIVAVPNWGWAANDPNISGAQIDTINDGHEWCYWNSTELDPGSPLNSLNSDLVRCDPNCYMREGGVTTATGHQPNTELITSYYFRTCPGPNVVNGHIQRPFTQQQLERFRQCWQALDIRTQLADACENRGGDSDSDGRCDADDNCRFVWQNQTMYKDYDSDGFGDVCDLCWTDPSPSNVNMDGDLLCDEHDDDDDNDGCPDVNDEDPRSAYQVAGPIIYPEGCLHTGPNYWTTPAGVDTDGDGLLDCDKNETNIDGDLLADAFDPCPTIPGASCARYGYCPSLYGESTCFGPGCLMDVYMLIEVLRKPDPIDWIRVDDVTVIGDRWYVSPRESETIVELAARHLLRGMVRSPDEQGLIRLALVDRSTGRKMMVARLDPSAFSLTDLGRGNTIEMVVRSGQVLSIAATWGHGVSVDAKLEDLDRDAVPDVADNCLTIQNRSQVDSDGDGFGDACDADFDQDGTVTKVDVARIQGCVGVQTSPHYVTLTPGEAPVAAGSVADAARRLACRGSDLDGDGAIGEADIRLAGLWLGARAGVVAPAASGIGTDAQLPETGTSSERQPPPDVPKGGRRGRDRTVLLLAVLLLMVGLVLVRRRR